MKHERKIEDYLELGAEFRLLKELMSDIVVKSGNMFPHKSGQDNRLARASNYIHEACSYADEMLFSDFQFLQNEYCSVFYGSTRRSAPYNEVDKDVLRRIHRIALELVNSDIETATWMAGYVNGLEDSGVNTIHLLEAPKNERR